MAREIVIIGGGIIGCTTAYYLSRHPSTSSSSTKIYLIEASEHGPAQGASGKAGGLVARWAYPKEIADISFDEHVKLATEHNGKERWGWRYVNCGSWEGRREVAPPEEGIGGTKSLEKTLGLPGGQKPIRSKRARMANHLPKDLLWLREDLTDSYVPVAKEGSTAQVHPYLFTTSMFELAKTNGVQYLNGKVTSIVCTEDVVTGVEYTNREGETERIFATHVILAAGAWSPTLVNELPITATRAHSIIIRPKEGVTIAPYVLFTEIVNFKTSAHRSPEIYARPDNEIYACGPGDDYPLPSTVDDVVVDPLSCDLIYSDVSGISHELREGTVEKRQACYLPTVSSGGGPIIGEAARIAKGLFIGTGHTCWGISNAPGTARALTELIMNGKIECADLKKLHPSAIL
ncbi:hypothetical protein M413DRAFT_149530 [Hebeloma cylindrosporum]|uniref:FAD dependent oxidoreductase domain-containing protein n=1 Tax=Hebeloma cylindrosporum TaxID=76867 RepID=A0A0C2YKB1_HEBCY|nr:hypothetical protein M413DRAFT_149530 [Hebeloma cylindrosporum h7]